MIVTLRHHEGSARTTSQLGSGQSVYIIKRRWWDWEALKRGMMGQQVATEHFGDYLSTLLHTHKLSVAGLAEAARLEPDLLDGLLSGRQILTADVAFSLAEVFGESPLALLEVQRACALGARERQEKYRVAA